MRSKYTVGFQAAGMFLLLSSVLSMPLHRSEDTPAMAGWILSLTSLDCLENQTIIGIYRANASRNRPRKSTTKKKLQNTDKNLPKNCQKRLEKSTRKIPNFPDFPLISQRSSSHLHLHCANLQDLVLGTEARRLSVEDLRRVGWSLSGASEVAGVPFSALKSRWTYYFYGHFSKELLF